MKTLFKFCSATSFCIAMVFITNGQVSTPNNFGILGNYVGWNAGQAFSLDIKHEAAQPINFYTNAGAGGFANMRMMIDGTNGFVGLNHSNPPGGIPSFPYIPVITLYLFS